MSLKSKMWFYTLIKILNNLYLNCVQNIIKHITMWIKFANENWNHYVYVTSFHSLYQYLFSAGYLDPGADSEHLAEGTKMELPFWMARALTSRKQATISIDLPKHFREGFRCGKNWYDKTEII